MRAFQIGLFALLIHGWAFAESWTNTVGHAVEATLVGRTGNVLEFKEPTGHKFKLRINSLSPECQIKAQRKCPLVTQTYEEIQRERLEQRIRMIQSR